MHNKPFKSSASHSGSFPFITISRETGAGGHSLAQLLLKEMQKLPEPLFQGWDLFDAHMCKKILSEAGKRIPLSALQREEFHTPIEDFFYPLLAYWTPQTDRLRKIFKMMRLSAERGKVIIIGRGASCFTNDIPGGLHVRLVASQNTRIERMQQQLDLTPDQARAMIERRYRSRRRLVRHYFKQDVSDPHLYDVVWDTGKVPLSEIVSHLLIMLRARNKAFHQERKVV